MANDGWVRCCLALWCCVPISQIALSRPVFTLNEDFEIEVEDNKSRSMKKAREALDACQRDASLPANEQIAQLAACMQTQVKKTLQKTTDEIAFQATLRQDMGAYLVDYTCDDPKATTTESYRNESWAFINPATRVQQEHEVQVLFETEMTAVKYIPNMLTVEQCNTLLDATIVDNQNRRVLPLEARDSMMIVEILMEEVLI